MFYFWTSFDNSFYKFILFYLAYFNCTLYFWSVFNNTFYKFFFFIYRNSNSTIWFRFVYSRWICYFFCRRLSTNWWWWIIIIYIITSFLFFLDRKCTCCCTKCSTIFFFIFIRCQSFVGITIYITYINLIIINNNIFINLNIFFINSNCSISSFFKVNSISNFSKNSATFSSSIYTNNGSSFLIVRMNITNI